jgi:hypothetical protein
MSSVRRMSGTFDRLPMFEPIVFPSRDPFTFNPAIPDRQLWAIGMVVAQWCYIELIMHGQILAMIGDDQTLKTEYEKQRSFNHKRQFWEKLIPLKMPDGTQKIRLLALIEEIKRLKPQRDAVIHNPWAGGMEGSSWIAEGKFPTTDAGTMGSMQKGGSPPWNLTYARLKQMIEEIGQLAFELIREPPDNEPPPAA